MKVLKKWLMLMIICSMVICNYGTEDNVKAASQTESSEEEEILLG